MAKAKTIVIPRISDLIGKPAFVEGQTIAEIVAECGMSEGSVRRRVDAQIKAGVVARGVDRRTDASGRVTIVPVYYIVKSKG